MPNFPHNSCYSCNSYTTFHRTASCCSNACPKINRLVTDRLSNLLLTPKKLSGENLRKEGVPEEKIKFVGNIMIDTLEANRSKAEQLNPETIIKDNLIEGQSLDFLKKSQNPDSTSPLNTHNSSLNTHHSLLPTHYSVPTPS